MSGFLLNTNIISELVKRKPEPKVTAWIDSTDENLLYLMSSRSAKSVKGSCRCAMPRAASCSRRGWTAIWPFDSPSGFSRSLVRSPIAGADSV